MSSTATEAIQTLLQMTLDHKMHERYYTKSDYEWSAQIRSQADRLQTLAKRLSQVEQKDLEKGITGTRPTIEEKAALTISQLELLNNRDVVPYAAILFYGHGGEPAELIEIRASLQSMEKTLRARVQMLFRYMEKHFSADDYLLEPKADWLEAAIWRSRLTTGLYLVATYYRMAAEMLTRALVALGKANLAGKALLEATNRSNAALLVHTAGAYLYEAAKFMGMAAVELGSDEERWQRLEKALKSILSAETSGAGGEENNAD